MKHRTKIISLIFIFIAIVALVLVGFYAGRSAARRDKNANNVEQPNTSISSDNGIRNVMTESSIDSMRIWLMSYSSDSELIRLGSDYAMAIVERGLSFDTIANLSSSDIQTIFSSVDSLFISKTCRPYIKKIPVDLPSAKANDLIVSVHIFRNGSCDSYDMPAEVIQNGAGYLFSDPYFEMLRVLKDIKSKADQTTDNALIGQTSMNSRESLIKALRDGFYPDSVPQAIMNQL